MTVYGVSKRGKARYSIQYILVQYCACTAIGTNIARRHRMGPVHSRQIPAIYPTSRRMTCTLSIARLPTRYPDSRRTRNKLLCCNVNKGLGDFEPGISCCILYVLNCLQYLRFRRASRFLWVLFRPPCAALYCTVCVRMHHTEHRR